MAYAKLVFSNGTYVLKKLKEIIRFATGQISTTADLEFADSSLSELVITEPPGWTLQAQSFEASGTATYSSYRITAPCVDGSKNKCVLVNTKAKHTETTDSIGYVNYSAAFFPPSSSATSGYLELSIGSSWTSTTLNNKTFSLFSFATNAVNSAEVTIILPGASLTANTIYIFCSNRKFIVFGNEDTGLYMYSSILEFPETIHTTKHNNIPVLLSEARRADRQSPKVYPKVSANATVTSNIGYGPGNNDTGYIAGGTYVYDYKQFFVNWYNPILNTRTNRATWDYGINNIEIITAPTALNINSSGVGAYPLIPMTDVRLDYGEGIHNYSALTDMYITYRASGYTGNGDTLDVNGTDYVILQVGDAATNYRAFAIKKG